MEQIGKIVSTNGNMAEVQIQRATACGGDCGKCSGCAPTAMKINARNEVHAQIGQMVRLASSTRNILAAAFIVYIVPIIILITTYIATYSYIISSNLPVNAQTAGIVTAICSLVLSFLVLRIIDKRLQKGSKLELTITSVIN
ncbi:SoxR reducing system RseC family protein [Petroclostridium sp. X23]|uniref:SoxR reducing system RseC family protein n=1 Tax=Petroclostridium sp. X23 TaxID=3045146 RepID=UPI0024AE12FF|nr:SoxR reducing system RseC family protein [Petroclostridium sp. X23]WHH59997.1 SoxR reducing system RseC family protein [Petroclostridium sp. X23]